MEHSFFPAENLREQRNIWNGSPIFSESRLWNQSQAFAAVFSQ